MTLKSSLESSHCFLFNLLVWASQMALAVKNPLPMQGTQTSRVQYLVWEDPLELEMETCSNILVWKNPMDRGA